MINLNLVPSVKKLPMEAEYAAEMAGNDSEVSVYKYIPQNAVGWNP